MQAAGHSRKESDDFSKLFLGDDGENQGLGVGMLTLDPELTEPSLSFHQPKSSFTYFQASFSRYITVIQTVLFYIRNNLMKFYVHPAVSTVLLIAAITTPVSLGYYVFHRDYKNRGELLVIDKSLESFEIPGHISSQREDMISVASKLSKEVKGVPTLRSKRSAEKPTKRQGPVYQKSAKWTLELVYLATGDDDLNIFTKERLESIHQIEQSLMNQEGFTDYCWKWEVAIIDPFLKEGCTPPISLVDFFFPSVTQTKMRIYDGQGRANGGASQLNLTEESIRQSLKLLLNKPFTYWFVDGSFSRDNPKSQFLRAEVKFGYPLKWGGRRRAQNERFKNYLVKYVEGIKKLSTE